MRLILLGKNGQLGWELQRTLAPLGELLCLDYPEIDLVKPANTCQMIRDLRPDILVNATAYTLVDKAETETDTAMAINATAPGLLAEAAAQVGAAFIHYSTDYVFDGTKGSPYIETDQPNPLNIYGRSKLAGEQAISAVHNAYWILRTSWVYSTRRDSFLNKVLGWARQNETIQIVADQIGNPTWARMLAEISAQLLAKSGADPASWIGERRGLYHLAGDDAASRLEWAEEILRLDPQPEIRHFRKLVPALTSDFQTPAVRPLYSALDCERFSSIFGLRLPHWKKSLEMAMEVVI